jgi:hypothetical protein
MNLFNINFDEVYRRHLCRHSQFGLNVWHLIAVIGVYFALFGIVFCIPGGPWIVGTVLTVYFAILAFNIPIRVLLLNFAVVGSLLLGFLSIPNLIEPIAFRVGVHVVLLLVWHRCQVWQHKAYNHSTDMSEFDGKYKKGFALFVLLAVYELPILLNYLFVDNQYRKLAEASANVAPTPLSAGGRGAGGEGGAASEPDMIEHAKS